MLCFPTKILLSDSRVSDLLFFHNYSYDLDFFYFNFFNFFNFQNFLKFLLLFFLSIAGGI